MSEAVIRVGVLSISDGAFRGIYADHGGPGVPGKPSAIAECLAAVFPAIPCCIDLIGGPRMETDPAVCVAFRPKGA